MNWDKIKTKVLIAGVVSSMLLAGCGGTAPKDDTTKKEKTTEESLTTRQKNWVADLKQIENELSDMPGVSEYLSDKDRKERINQLIDDVREKDLEDDEIYYRLRELISDIHIAHLAIHRPESYYDGERQVYIMAGEWFADGFYIMGTRKENEESLGSKLIAINGISLDEVLERYDKIISNETQVYLKKTFEWYSGELCRADLIYLGIIDKTQEDVTFTFEKDGKEFEQVVHMTTISDEKTVDDMVYFMKDNEKLPYGEKLHATGKPFLYEFDKEHRTFYFQYNECLDPTVGNDYAEYPVFADFMDEMMTEVENHSSEIDRFVLDLRYNGGGSEMLWNDAVEKYKDVLNQYEVDVLIGSGTFSAGVDAIDTTLYQLDHVVLYGGETGLAVHNYTDVGLVYLEKTGYVLQIVKHADYSEAIDKRAEDLSRGVMPDVEVMQTFEDYVNGIDDVYEKVVEGSPL